MKVLNFPKVYPTVYWCVCCSFCCLISNVQAADAFSGHYGGNGQGKSNGVRQRDPFTTSDKIYDELGIQSAQKSSNAHGFILGYGNQTVPKMKVKGFVNRGAKKSTALLDIEGAGIFLVSEGDEIGLQALGQNTVLKIFKLDSNSVKVQSGQVKQVIIVR